MFKGIKDFLYDYVDSILVIAIIIIVGGTLMWRLDILFASDIDKPSLEEEIMVSNDVEVKDKDKETKDNSEVEDNKEVKDKPQDSDIKDNDEDNSKNEKEETPKTDKPKEVTTIVVEIPKGSLGPTIGDILVNKGLIKDKWEFLKRAQELGLDTKLKSGTFKIKSNSSLDTVIKIISRSI